MTVKEHEILATKVDTSFEFPLYLRWFEYVNLRLAFEYPADHRVTLTDLNQGFELAQGPIGSYSRSGVPQSHAYRPQSGF